jgi:hypothetical protein
LNAVFLEWIERLQKCVQVDGEYVGWTKRTLYIEIDFNRAIHLCYTWRETPYMTVLQLLSRRIHIGVTHAFRNFWNPVFTQDALTVVLVCTK